MEHYVAHLESLYLGDFYYCLEQISDPIEEKNSTHFFISIRLGNVNSSLFSSFFFLFSSPTCLLKSVCSSFCRFPGWCLVGCLPLFGIRCQNKEFS